MIIINAVEGKKIHLGRIGENEARAVRFDVSRILAEFPGASISVLNMRPSDPDAYPVNGQYIALDGSYLLWTLQSGDLAEDGLGQCELKATLDGAIVKSIIWTTEICPALDGNGTPPEPWESWQQQVEDDADRAAESAEDSEAWAVGERGGVQVVEGDPTYENNAKYYAEEAASTLANKADKADTVLTTTLSRGRKAETTVGTGSIAFGDTVEASGVMAKATGHKTKATGNYSSAEGMISKATATAAHAEGATTEANGNYSHAEGNQTVASGAESHAEGYLTTASGEASHAEGHKTVANHYAQHVFGTYNVADDSALPATSKGNYVEIVGCGGAEGNRRNARTLDWNGNERLKGKLYVEANVDGTGGSEVAKKSDIPEPVDISGKADKVAGAVAGNFAGLDAEGNLTDSGHKASDFLTEHQDISGKADKVTGATNGNLAGLDGSGNLTDSGKKATDFVPVTSFRADAMPMSETDPKTVAQTATELKSHLAYDEADINDLFERLGFVGDITTTNLLNESALTQSKMVDYSGAVVDAPNNTWYVTDLLSIGNVTELFTTYRLANMALIACYDANDTFIGIITTNSTGKERLVQNNDYWKVILYPGTAKVRMNIRSAWIGSTANPRQMLTKYYYPSSYVAYGSSVTVSPSTISAKADFMYKYGIRVLGLFGNTSTYSNLNTMPVNTYACFYSTGATGISNRPVNAFATILEVYTVSTSDTLSNGTVQIVFLKDGDNNYWVYARTYISSTWTSWFALNEKSKTITVRTNGGNYTSVVDAIKYTMDNPPTKETPVVIDVGAGTFDLNDVASLVESESIDQRGLFLMPYVTLQGKGRDKTILSFEYNGSNDDVMSQVSALNIVYESALKDMKIQVKNIRYAVHADYALSTQAQDDTNTLLRDNTFIMENVELVHKGFDSGLSPTYKVPSAWGQGLRTNLIRKFINCRFESFGAVPWFCHDRIETSKGCQLFFDGCEFIPHDNSASLRFVSWGSNLLHIVNIRNCIVRTFVSLGVVTTYNASAKINYFVKADDLDALFVEDTVNDSAKQMNYYNYRTLMCINKTNDTVTKFTPVKILTYNNAVVNTRNGIQGIAMHNAAANEMVNVQIDGAVAIATSFTAGTRIGYSNGAWVEDQNGFLVVMNAVYCRFV